MLWGCFASKEIGALQIIDGIKIITSLQVNVPLVRMQS